MIKTLNLKLIWLKLQRNKSTEFILKISKLYTIIAE
jgi:hypothetical protein